MDVFDFPKASKILIVRLSAFGDLILSIPAAQTLCRLRPDMEVHWLTAPPYKELLESVEGLTRIWTIDLKNGLAGYRRTAASIQQLRKEKFEGIIDFQGLIKSAVPAWLARGQQLIGPDSAAAREPLSSFFYSSRVKISEMKLHQIEFHYRLLLGDRKEIEVNPGISLQMDTRADHYVKNELSKLEMTRPILLNPGGGWNTKLWSARRFAQLSKLIETELDIPTLFTWGPGEEDLGARIKDFEPAHVRSFPTNILELARLCTYSRLMVAGDTGPMHLAVSMGTPVVAILGPAHVWRTGPFGKNNISITHSRPCPHPYQRKCDDHFCMDIAVEKVFEGIKKRLNID